MTVKEEKEVIRVCGKDYTYQDIPAYIRERDSIGLEARADGYRQEEKERREREKLENY